MHVVEDQLRGFLKTCGFTEAITYSFISEKQNELFSTEEPLRITNALSENINTMRLSIIPGLLQAVAHNRNYGNRDGALFEVGRTYHRGEKGMKERHRAAIVLFGGEQSHWSEPRRAYDFYDAKGIVEQMMARHHMRGEFASAEVPWLRPGQAAIARAGESEIAVIGVLRREIAEAFDMKGDVVAAEIDVDALVGSFHEWKMTPISRYPGVPMVLGLMHKPSLTYQQVIEKIRSLDVPYLQEVGLRDRYFPPDAEEVKTLLGMWYQAADRSLTQEEVAEIHQSVSDRLAGLLPVNVLRLEGEKV
jgi:phenylalanyl-tRNA synthetase beta chain